MNKKNKICLLLMASTLLSGMSMVSCGNKEKPNEEVNKARYVETTLGNEVVYQNISNPTKDVKINLCRGKNIIATGTNELNYSNSLQAGDIIDIESDYKYITVSLFDELGDTIIYSENGKFLFQVPTTTLSAIYPTGTFTKKAYTFTANPTDDSEFNTKRNLALNPYDMMMVDEKNDQNKASLADVVDSVSVENNSVGFYPHIYSNRVTRNEVGFYARNAIDGNKKSDGHGSYPYESWGYNQKDDAELVLYFGRKVNVEEIKVTLRADYAVSGGKEHDTYWDSAVLEFSDGTEVDATFTKDGDAQVVELDAPIKTESVRIKEIKTHNSATSENFAALTELEVLGTDLVTKNEVKKAQKFVSSFRNNNKGTFKTNEYSSKDIKDTIDNTVSWFINKTESAGGFKIPDYNGNPMEVKLATSDWKDSVFYSGMMDYFLTTGSEDAYVFLRSVGDQFKYLIDKGYQTPHGDWYQIGETYMLLSDISYQGYKIDAPKKNADYVISRKATDFPSGDGVNYDKSRDWSNMAFWWCDALYMAMNSYTMLSRITDDDTYVEKCYAGYTHWKDVLYNDTYHLWHRDTTQLTVNTNLKDDNGKPVPTFWARGNAWVLAALAKQMLYLDKDRFPEIYESYKNDFIELAEAIVSYQREDGTWNASIVDETYYGGKEATGTSGFLYGLATGLSLGILGDNYYTYCKNAYEGIMSCMLTDSSGNLTGQLGYMQTTGYQPQNYKNEEYSKELTHEFGMGLYLLGASAMMRLCEDYQTVEYSIPLDAQANLL